MSERKRNYWQLLASIPEKHLFIVLFTADFLMSPLLIGKNYDLSGWMNPLIFAFVTALVYTAKLRYNVPDSAHLNILIRVFRSAIFPFAYASVWLVGIIILLTVRGNWVHDFWFIFRLLALLIIIAQLLVAHQVIDKETRTAAE